MNFVFIKELKKLIKLQEYDNSLALLGEEIENIPQEIKKLEEDIKLLQQNISQIKENIKNIQLQIKQRELDLQSVEQQIKKHTQELNSVKTNEQYRALLDEINNLNKQKDKIETEILELMSNLDISNKEFNEKEKIGVQKQKEIEQEIKKLENKKQQLIQQIEEIRKEREKFCLGIEKKYLEIYERITLNRKDALSAVDLSDKSCGKCHMKLTQQEINEISKYEDFVFCETCSRILYIPSDLENL